MAQTDRTAFIGNTGIKKPVKAATTANIVLSAEQTIDGVACVTGDRVLVKDQATASENGVYDVDTGGWTRARDFDGVYNVVKGTLIFVNPGGSSNGDALFRVSTDDTITIGTSSLAFVRENINFVTLVSFVASAAQTLFNLSSTYQIGSSAIAVYVNGLRARLGADYAETSASSITFTYALQVGDEVDCYIGTPVGQITAAAASQSAVADAGDFWVGTTVEAVLQEVAGAIATDNGDADATFTNATSQRVQRWNTPLTADRTFNLATASAKEGAWVCAVRAAGATGNFTLAIGALATLRAPGEWALCVYDLATAAWVLESYGTLPSAEVRAVSADNGDASVNLTIGTSERTQRWATSLTADRTATLQSTRAHSGARFKVVREATAKGNFALVVTDGTTAFARLAPGQTADLEHTGAAWKLVGVQDHPRPNTATVLLIDDFLGEEVAGYRWQGLVGTDAACRQATVLADQINGVARMTTGAGAGATMAVNGVQLNSRLNWRANQGGLAWECRVAIDAITNAAIFIGLTNQISALQIPINGSGVGDGLTNNAADAVGVLFDTAMTTKNWWMVGVRAAVAAVAQNSGVAPTAGTFEIWRIELDTNGQASFYRNGTLISTVMAGAVTASVLLTPVVAVFARAAASRNVDVDFVSVQAQRYI